MMGKTFEPTCISNEETINLSKTRNNFLLLWSSIVIFQCIIWPSIEGVIGAVVVLLGGVLGIYYCLRRYLLLNFPISTLILLGYLSYYFLLPPFATIIEGKELVNNLVEPELVFFNALICLLVLLFVHVIYSQSIVLNTIKHIFRDNLYRPLGFFSVPTNPQLMLMGFIGIIPMAMQTFMPVAGVENAVGMADKIIQGFYPLVYVPYCILIKKIIGGEPTTGKQWLWIIILYTFLLLFLAIGKNSRSAFLMGMMSICLAYLYMYLTGLVPKRIFNIKRVAIATGVLILISGPLSDIAISMVVVRGQRVDISALDLISETVSTYQDKELIRIAKNLMVEDISDWDESYVDNVFFSRISNLKFTDNSLSLAYNLDFSEIERLRDIEWGKIISIMPSPIIQLLGLNIDKTFVTSGSGGDFLYAVATGDNYVIGGFRTGSIFGSGYAIFGWLYPLVFGFVCLITFPLVDSLCKVGVDDFKSDSHDSTRTIFNSLTVASLFSWFFYLTSAATGAESMSELAGYIFRGWIQTLIIYLIAYWSTHGFLRLLTSR